MKTTKMQWRREDVGYCTNVHPCRSLQDCLDIIRGPMAQVAQGLGYGGLGAGLWLPNDVALHLKEDSSATVDFTSQLAANGINLTTLNGFPYGDFHQASVKQEVYLPDWSNSDRLRYTKALAECLCASMAQDRQVGSISTLPLGYRISWNDDKHRAAIEQLLDWVEFAQQLELAEKKLVRLGIEMEPDCVLDTTVDTLVFFDQLKTRAGQRDITEEQVQRYLGLCFDCCHQAVMHEDIRWSLEMLREARIDIVKIQLSNAIEVPSVDGSVRKALIKLVEPKYLHQLCRKEASEDIQRFADLTVPAINDMADGQSGWRIHFHVPINTTQFEIEGATLGTTQSALLNLLDELCQFTGIPPDLEVETYSWPQWINAAGNNGEQTSLVDLICDELKWLHSEMDKRNLLVV